MTFFYVCQAHPLACHDEHDEYSRTEKDGDGWKTSWGKEFKSVVSAMNIFERKG